MKSSHLIVPILLLASACSTLSKRSFSVQEGIIYKTVENRTLTANLYLPTKEGLKPAVVVVHGGGWTKKTGDLESVCRDLAKAGFVVFQPNYRLSPHSRFPLPVEDIKDAVKWVREHHIEYSVDTERIGGWGYSAGANLILLAGLDSKSGLKAIVAGGTPADLTVWPDSPLVFDFIGATLQAKPELWKAASPVYAVNPDSPPLFLYHGALDNVVGPEQMTKMKAAMDAKNRPVQTHSVSYMGHFAVYLFSQESVSLGIQFLNRKPA